MSFVPLSGPATFRPGIPPREGTVEFTDARRTVTLPIRSAMPVLTRAHARDDLHPTVGLLSGSVLLGLRLVAAGRFEPDPVEAHWRVAPLGGDDEERVRLLARARAHDLEPAAAEGVVRAVLDAVIDTMPRSAPAPAARVPRRPRRYPEELAARLAARVRAVDDDRPHLVRLSLRVEADEDELVAGAVRLVLQAHDERNPLHVCDAALLWTESGPDATHGFGHRARTHATIALRDAATAWPVLDRLLELPVPDQIVLGTDELVSLLDRGVADLRERGVDVLWPRSPGRDLSAHAVLEPTSRPGPAPPRENPVMTGLFGPEAMFAFRWQVAWRGDPLTPQEMDQLAGSAAPILKLRGQWTVVDPALARKARKRLIRTVSPAQAVAASLTGVASLEPVGGEGPPAEEHVVVGASLLQARDLVLTATAAEPVPPPPGLRATLRDYQLRGLAWLDRMTSLGLGVCLADDMGLGKTVTLIALHLHRGSGPTLVVCPASLLGNWEDELRRFAPGVRVRRFHGGQRSLEDLEDGVVLTTYGTMRLDDAALAAVDWDLVVADEAQHVKNARSSTARALRRIPSRARVALTGTPVENNLSELWAILDWATPGLLGSRQAFRKVWAGPIESGLEPTKAARFRTLVEPFLLRRRKADPGIAPELPAKTETDHRLSLTDEQVVLYEAFVRETLERIERADHDSRRGLVLALLTGLKQICNHPAHFLKQSGPRLSGRSQKLDLLDELLGTVLAEEGAALVFTQYVAMARLLESHLGRIGVPHQFLHGGTPVAERERMVARFQAGEVPVFLLSLKAGGTGLNLTQADHVVHIDRWWNPAVEEQATDRAYRIGQTRPVQVHRMITTGTIEEKVAELLTRKRALADAVLVRGETALTELDDAELRDFVTLRQER